MTCTLDHSCLNYGKELLLCYLHFLFDSTLGSFFALNSNFAAPVLRLMDVKYFNANKSWYLVIGFGEGNTI